MLLALSAFFAPNALLTLSNCAIRLHGDATTETVKLTGRNVLLVVYSAVNVATASSNRKQCCKGHSLEQGGAEHFTPRYALLVSYSA